MFLSHTHIMNNHLNNQIIENASKVSRNLSSEELYEILIRMVKDSCLNTAR